MLKAFNKEKFLKSDNVKSNDESMMKSNDEIPSHHGSENEGTGFFEVYWKASASKTYKSSHEEVFPKIGVLKP